MMINKTDMALSGCKLKVVVTPTDFDQDSGSVELIEYLSVNGQRRVTNAAPGQNPCKVAHASETSVASVRQQYTLVDEDVSPDAGIVELEGKISPQVDECASNGYLLDGFAEVTCCLGQDTCAPEDPPAAFDVVYQGFGDDATCAEASYSHEVATTGLHLMQSLYGGQGDDIHCFPLASLPWNDGPAVAAYYSLWCDPKTGDLGLRTFGADSACDPSGEGAKDVLEITASDCLLDKSSGEYARHRCQLLGQGSPLSVPKAAPLRGMSLVAAAESPERLAPKEPRASFLATRPGGSAGPDSI